MSDIFFGVGHGYGGTHLLAKLLDLSPEVDCKHERRDGYSTFALFDKYQSVYAGLENPNKILINERQIMIENTLADGYMFGEVNGILTFFMSAIHYHYPEAKFVYLTRDPRQQILSMFNTGMYDEKIFASMRKVQLWMLSRQKAKFEILKKEGKKISLPPPRQRQKFTPAGEPTYTHWNRMTKLEKCAWSWRLVNEEALLHISKIPEELVFIYKFEDMIQGKRLEELYEFLGLSFPRVEDIVSLLNVKHNETPLRVPRRLGPWNKLDLPRKNLILQITSGTREKLGYE